VTQPTVITPDPSEEEVVAILAALQAATPGPGSAAPVESPRWKWSGRWWSKPIPARRVRPW